MSSSSKSLVTWICCVIVGGYAIYTHSQISKLQMINKIGSEARVLNDDNFRDVMFSLMHDIRNNTIENSRNTGKVEGMLSVISNQKPSDSETSALWHAGYYRGIDQQNDIAALAYEEGYHKACDDASCPVDRRPSSETIRAKSPFNKNKEEEIQPVSNSDSKPKPTIKPSQNIEQQKNQLKTDDKTGIQSKPTK